MRPPISSTPSSRTYLAPVAVAAIFGILAVFTADACSPSSKGPSSPSNSPNPAAALCVTHRTVKELECVDMNPDKASIDTCRAKVRAEIECVDAGSDAPGVNDSGKD